jgi:hypothetical protein
VDLKKRPLQRGVYYYWSFTYPVAVQLTKGGREEGEGKGKIKRVNGTGGY